MAPWLQSLIALCLLRSGPQHLPYAPNLTRNLVIAGIALDLVYAALLELPDPLPRIAMSLALLLGVPWVLLNFRGRSARYVQTLGALAGTGVLFTLAFLPVALFASGLPEPVADQAPSRPQLAVGWLTLLLLGWKLMINAHIWRHALDWPRLSALLLAFGLFLLELGLDRLLFEAPR